MYKVFKLLCADYFVMGVITTIALPDTRQRLRRGAELLGGVREDDANDYSKSMYIDTNCDILCRNGIG